MGVHLKIQFSGGFKKPIYKGGMPKKGKLRQLAGFRGGMAKKRGWYF